MPALAFRRRSYQRKWGRPKRFVWTVPGPYIKTGTGVSGYIGSGGDATTFVEAGTGIANLIGSGSAVKLSPSLLLRNPLPFVTRSRRRTLR